jgi:WD40 repeat protein
MAFGQRGNLLLTADSRGLGHMLIMDTNTDLQITWPGGTTLGPMSAAAYDPNAGWVAGFFHDGKFEIRGEKDAESRQLGGYDARRPQAGIRLSASGHRVCLIDGAKASVLSTDGKAVKAGAGRRDREPPESANRVLYSDTQSSVAFSDDGSTVLLALGQKAGTFKKKSQTRPAELVAYRPESGGYVSICQLPVPTESTPPPLCLAISADGGLAMVSTPGTLAVYDVATYANIWMNQPPGPVTAAAFSARGDFLATACQQNNWSQITIWDTYAGEQPAGAALRGLRQFRVDYPVTRLLISPDWRFLVTGNDNDSTLWGLLP